MIGSVLCELSFQVFFTAFLHPPLDFFWGNDWQFDCQAHISCWGMGCF